LRAGAGGGGTKRQREGAAAADQALQARSERSEERPSHPLSTNSEI
jgi:hypothetical protein